MDHLIVNFTVKNLSVLIIFSIYQNWKQIMKEEFFSYFKKNIKKLSFSDADIANIFLKHLLGSYSQLLKIILGK